MPCLYEETEYEKAERRKKYQAKQDKIFNENKFLEAALCAVLTAITGPMQFQIRELIVKIDWDEAGITSAQLETWWTDHQKKDAIRLEQERNQALAKLTPAEKKLLGLIE